MSAINSEQVTYNLLKGWMDCNSSGEISKNLAETGRAVLVIDDNWDQYKECFHQILGNNVIEFFNNDYTIEDFKNDHDLSGCINRLNEVIFSCCLVISDLYLTENHGNEFHSSPENAELISGFVLNKEIKKINPMLPVMMFTASNKVWNYRLFDSYGIDEWVVKFDAPFTGQADSAITKSFFQSFETAILNLITTKPYLFLMDLYLNVNSLSPNGLWWDSPGVNKRGEIITIVNESLLALKNLLNKQLDYEKILSDQNKIYTSSAYTCSAIISQLGNIVEVIYNLYERQSNRNADDVEDGISFFLLKNRNLAAHKNNYKEFALDDVILELALIEFMLKQQVPWNKFTSDYSRKGGFIIPSNNPLLWIIVALYNKHYALPKPIKKLLKDRAAKHLDTMFRDQKNGNLQRNELIKFKQRMQHEPNLYRLIIYKSGPPRYKLHIISDEMFIELVFP
jgi:hypothetical protein